MANIFGKITVDEQAILSVDAVPSLGLGTPAEIGDLAIVDGAAGFYQKTGLIAIIQYVRNNPAEYDGLSPFITDARLLKMKNDIEAFLGLSLTP